MPEPEDPAQPVEPQAPTEPLLPPSNDPTGQVFVEADDAPPPTTEIDTEAAQRPSALRTATPAQAKAGRGPFRSANALNAAAASPTGPRIAI